MRKHLSIILVISLCIAGLTACGKADQGEDIKVIEANDTAESKEKGEVQYEQTNIDNIPDADSTQDNSETYNEGEAVLEMEPTIYGVWLSDTGSNLQIYNSSEGIQFAMFDAELGESIVGTATTDNKTYIEVTYLKPVEDDSQTGIESTQEESIETEVDEQPQLDENGDPIDEALQEYGSDDEFYAAMETEHKDLYETIKYTIEKNEFNSEISTMYLTLKDNNKSIELYMPVTTSTPDYSKEDNNLVNVGDSVVIEEIPEEEVEQTIE